MAGSSPHSFSICLLAVLWMSVGGGGAGMKDTVFRGSALRNFKVLTEDKEQKQHHQAEGPCRPQLVNKMSGRLQQGVTSKGRKRKWFIESVATELMAV